MEYLPIVSLDDPNALLPRKPIYEWYRRWEDRGLFWEFHGNWENRIAAMSEAELWTYRVDETVRTLNIPTLMIHADRAATGAIKPKRIFEQIATADKQLVWLGNSVQFQFYEEPETIDQCVANSEVINTEQGKIWAYWTFADSTAATNERTGVFETGNFQFIGH